ncbi:hypothetical protein B6R59_002930 [Escherichia coli]|nr:hypothetical protein [Escherichia coli]
MSACSAPAGADCRNGTGGWPDVTPPGHTEQATPVGAPMRTPAEPWTMLPPYCVMSP